MNTERKLWHDDIRRPPDETWEWARTNEEAKRILSTGEVTEASLDHDLGLHEFDPDDEEAMFYKGPHPEGYALVEWMIESGHVPLTLNIHSWNPPGAARMAIAFKRAGYTVSVIPFRVAA